MGRKYSIVDSVRYFASIHDTPEFHWCLGVMWGVGSVIGEKFAVRHRDFALLHRLARTLKHVSGPYRLPHPGVEEWAIHVPLSHPLYTYLVELGWRGRWNEDRPYPTGLAHEDEFIRGFVGVHHTLDVVKLGRERKERQRLRIYGSRAILEGIDRFFVNYLGTTPKKVQEHSRSNVCHLLYYQSQQEVPVLRGFLGI